MTNLDILLNAKGIGPSALEKFKDAGYESIEDVCMESPNDLSDKVNGVGYTTAISVLKYLEKEGYRKEKKNDEELEKLVELLQELFEFDAKERDFGVYKLMNANRDKIDKFIQEDLVNTIENEIQEIQEKFSGKSKENAREEVLEELGTEEFFDENNNMSKKAERLLNEKTGVSENELDNIRSDIYNHIYTFFSNYYNDGDFINRRKRSHHEEPYSVPYDGSDTNFHWVTKNQYYAKTSEQFMRFTFNHQNNSYKFNTINSAYDGSGIGNNKYFVMDNIDNIDISDNEIKVNFYRRMIGEKDLERFENISKGTRSKQDKMNETFTKELTDKFREENISFEKEKLQNKIDEYTTRNQNDFFIHKNLEKFLESELEEYIKTNIVKFNLKNGVDSLTDISIEKARVINEVSIDIILFISQIEEFKRKLFEKKKFITNKKKLHQLTEIPEEHYDTVLDNKKQLEVWKESYSIDVNSLTTDMLEQQPYNQMVVDTSYFEGDITTGEEPQNKLIKGDNYQALNFLQEKYEESVKCIYIDPPYNTGNVNFAYKDKYQRPTWLSMMYDRLKQAKEILREDGVIFVSIDDNEEQNIKTILDTVFGEENRLATLIWNLGAGTNRGLFKRSHEYILVYAKDESSIDSFRYQEELDELHDFDSDEIVHPSVTKGNNSHKIKFPEGSIRNIDEEELKYTEGESLGQTSRMSIAKGNLVFNSDGWLDEPVVLEAEWEMSNKLKEWLENGEATDSKGQPIKEFFFKNNEIYHRKERTTMTPSTVIDGDSTRAGRATIERVLGYKAYDYPKPVSLVKNLIGLHTSKNDIVLDFFAGSGTTAQAVHELNRERDEQVNYILVEMLDEAFDITEERVKRTAFSKEWKDGKPQLGEIEHELGFSAECIELESYEEALDAVKFDKDQSSLGDFKDTLLNYMLDFGTKDSPVFLETDQLSKPKEYTLDGELKENSVDIMTTFNYLIGLNSITKETKIINDVVYTIYDGVKYNENICVIWRHNANKVDYELEKEELDIDDYDRIYINGDSIIEDSIPISSEFKNKMLND